MAIVWKISFRYIDGYWEGGTFVFIYFLLEQLSEFILMCGGKIVYVCGDWH